MLWAKKGERKKNWAVQHLRAAPGPCVEASVLELVQGSPGLMVSALPDGISRNQSFGIRDDMYSTSTLLSYRPYCISSIHYDEK